MEFMFKLLFSPFGTISRGKFLLGIFDLIGLFILCVIIWSFICTFMANQLGLQDLSKAYSDAMKYSKSMTMNGPKTNTSTNSSSLKSSITIKSPDLSPLEEKAIYKITVMSIIFFALVYFTSLWCKLCLFLKRLEDIGLPRWLAAVPFIAGGIFFTANSDMLFFAGAGASVLFYALMIFWPSRASS